MAWRLFQWGARGLYYDTGLGVYVAHDLIARCVQVTLFGFDIRGDDLLHVFHCQTTNDPPDSADCSAIAGVVTAWVAGGTNPFHGVINTEIHVTRVIAQSIAEFEGPFAEQAIGAVGTRAGTANPSVLCANLKKSSDHGGRSRRGYFASWPAVAADLLAADHNVWDPAYIQDLLDCYAQLESELGSADYPLVIGSHARNTMYPVTRITSTTPFVRNRHSRAGGIGN